MKSEKKSKNPGFEWRKTISMDKKARGNPRESDVTNGPKENG